MGDTEVRRARTAADSEAVGRVRFEVYCRRRQWLDPADYPDGIERDEYDARSTHLLALDDGEPIGTVRLVHAGPHGFPIERAFERPPLSLLGVDAWDARLAEVSRLAVVRSDAPHVLVAALIQVLDRNSIAGGITAWLTATDANARRLAIERLGIVSGQYADAKEYCGSLTVPGVIVLERMMAHFAAERPAMHAFFSSDWPDHEVVAQAARALESRVRPGSSAG